MKQKMFVISSVLLLMVVALASGCAQQSQSLGEDYYAHDLYKMVSKAEHEKRFSHEHEKKAGDDENKRCYYNEGTSAYFCQYWGDWDE